MPRLRYAVLLLAAGALSLAACSTGPSTARYCDVVKVAQAGVDPLANPAIFNNPALLKAALASRVKTYGELANRAPTSVRADAAKVRDALITLNNALAKDKYASAAANTDPAVQSIIKDVSVQDATARLQSFNLTTCGAG
jgi:hypothetical protein